MTTLVLDNGAYNAKIGYSHENVSVIPNCQFRSKTARLKTFTANQIDEIKDPSGLFYILPFQKGYLVNWDVQRQVWDYLFGKEMYQPREEMVLSGKYKSGEQILRLANERFAVPEIFFFPFFFFFSFTEMQPHFFKNIVLTGGNSLFPGFRDRVYSEVRCLTPTDYDVSVVLPENPITYAWEGGKLISENDDFEDMVVTREDYEENGHSVCEEKFDI
ncbi:PREDICTED: actin-related protein 6 [Propithecus coquereli]|uniref:actin-related protein 6 n=1 Tax=Propithecus coquereli TaxID=379532 RepID=UPI00063FA977|nr:PREDICTED: actin-related protein 6 [Propithecus coquereli]